VDRDALEQVAAIERCRLDQRIERAVADEPLEGQGIDADRIPIEGDRLAVGAQRGIEAAA
jgi:hypothetical protein